MDTHFVITLGRQFGSGGRLIGEKLANKLGFSYYDKELINIASRESGLGAEFFEQADEKSKFNLFGGLLGLRAGISADDFMNNYLSNETLFKIQSDVIRELAAKQSCVFVGRCADYILRDNPNGISIFITANTDDRIKRVEQRQPELAKEKIKDLLEKTDKKRAGYYDYYTNKEWGTAKAYDLCINSSLLGVEETVDFLETLIRKKFNLK